MVTRPASARHRPTSGEEAAVSKRSSGRNAAARLSSIWQCLLGLAPGRKHLERSALDQLVSVPDAKMMAAFVLIKLLPSNWRRYRRAFTSAGGIGHDGGGPALVSQPVEEDPAGALDLANIGRECFWLCFGDCTAEALGETFHVSPVLRRVERDDDMKTFAP